MHQRTLVSCIRTTLCFSLYFILFARGVYAGSNYYVSTAGDDSNPGTLSQPFRTIQKGINSLGGVGDALYLRSGRYNVGALTVSNKRGTASDKILISGYESERPILDAAGAIQGLWDNFIYFSNVDHVTVKNIEIANSRTKGIYLAKSTNVLFQNIWIHHTALAAIWAEDSSHNLTIEHSKFWLNNLTNDSANAHIPSGYSESWYQSNMWMGALVVRGSSSDTGPYIEGTVIRNNEIFNQFGECINIHGRASDVRIEDNVIYNCWGPAIYYPNSKDILIQRNLVYHTGDARFLRNGNPGAGIGSQKEHPPTRPGEMRNIRIINNLVKGFSSNFFFWSYDGGYLEDTLIAHNTFINAHSNSGNPATNINIGAGPHIRTRFENNIVLQDDASGRIGASDGSMVFSNNTWSTSPPSSMRGEGDIIADPKIRKVGSISAGQLQSEYFALSSDSPAINTAKQIGITQDFFSADRNRQDMGAIGYDAQGQAASIEVSSPIATPTLTISPRIQNSPSPTTPLPSYACPPNSQARIGDASFIFTVPKDGNYKVWLRLKKKNSGTNFLWLDIDNAFCVKIGDTRVFSSDASWIWIDYMNANIASKIPIRLLSKGSHAITLISSGLSHPVEVDSILLTRDTLCVPQGFGDACAGVAPTPTLEVSQRISPTVAAASTMISAKPEFSASQIPDSVTGPSLFQSAQPEVSIQEPLWRKIWQFIVQIFTHS